MNLLPEIIPDISREEEFVLCHARTGASGPAKARIDRLTASPLNWKRIADLAALHRIGPLLYKHLRADRNRPQIPAPIWKQFEGHAISTATRNRAQSNELVRIIKLLRAENITALPFKGPVLAGRIYGDLGLREFSDLDLLIRSEDLLRAKLLLVHHGFTSPSAQKNASEGEHIEAQLGSDFLSADGDIQLELHSSLQTSPTDRADIEGIWKRAAWIDLAGQPIRTIAREDLLPYLCAQGAKHHWARVIWIVDISEFIRAEHDIDWPAVLKTAHGEGSWRVVALGLYLAYGLLDAPLPRDIATEITTPEIQQLAQSVGTWLFNESNRPTAGALDETRFFWKTSDRVTDRVAYSLRWLTKRRRE